MNTIRERSDAVVEKLRLPSRNTCVFHRAEQIADAIFEEFRNDYRVIIVTLGGIFGSYHTGDRVKCEESKRHLDDWRASKSRHSEATVHFDPPGMGYGAPCPLDAIAEVIILKPGEQLSKEMVESAIENAAKFHEALAASEN
jgi:hypothetical protein